MSVFVNPLKSKKAILKEETNLQIANHKKVAAYLEAAAKNHLDAAKYYAEENREFAAFSAIAAYNHLELAIERQKKLIKNSL